MTPEQQSALEYLVARPISPEDAKVLDPWLEWDVRNDAAIADHFSVGRCTGRSEYWLTDRGLVADLVAATGSLEMSDSILNKLDAAASKSRSVKAMLNRLENDARGINFGDPALLAQLPMLGIFDEAELAALRELSVHPAPLTVNEVSDALNKAEGRTTL